MTRKPDISKRVLVCGGRNFNDRKLLVKVLDDLYLNRGMTTLIEGEAKGADQMSAWWAEAYNIIIERYPANWSRYGRSAGHIRNQQMIDEGKPDLVVAFPGGKGTDNMVQRAKAAQVLVLDLR